VQHLEVTESTGQGCYATAVVKALDESGLDFLGWGHAGDEMSSRQRQHSLMMDWRRMLA
jgi:hypothetical protein